MLTFSGFRIQRGKESIARRVDWGAFAVGALSGALYSHQTSAPFVVSFSVVLLAYFTVSYVLLSYFRACEVKTFPKHRMLRIAFSLIVAVLVIPEMIEAVVQGRLQSIGIASVCLFLIALQSVVNGFVFRKEEGAEDSAY